MALTVIGSALVVCGLIGAFSGRLRRYQCDGLYALSFVPFEIYSVRTGNRFWIVVDAVGFAVFAYRWWTGGGGDGTRRRLRSLRPRFTPSRRTAPQSA